MIVIANAFSVNMLEEDIVLKFRRVDVEEVKEIFIQANQDTFSVVGHEPTANLFSKILNYPIMLNRAYYCYKPGDVVIVGSIQARLPEGKILTDEEMRAIKIVWWIIEGDENGY